MERLKKIYKRQFLENSIEGFNIAQKRMKKIYILHYNFAIITPESIKKYFFFLKNSELRVDIHHKELKKCEIEN